MSLLIALFAKMGASQRVARLLAVGVPIVLAALCVAFLWARGTHYRDQRDTARAQIETVNAKLAVSNASIAELQASLSRYVGAGKAAQVAQLASIERQAKDNAALQAQADAIRAEVAKMPAGKCETPKTVITAKGL